MLFNKHLFYFSYVITLLMTIYLVIHIFLVPHHSSCVQKIVTLSGSPKNGHTYKY